MRSVSRIRRNAGKRINRDAQITPGGFVQIVAYPLLTSMFVAGVWHGANLPFLVFGLLHGSYLVVNHAWRLLTPEGHKLHNKLPIPAAIFLTFTSVVLGQIFFRAESINQALYVLGSLLGRHVGSPWNQSIQLKSLITLLLCFPIVWLMPNVQEILGLPTREPLLQPWYRNLHWRPTLGWSLILTTALCLSIIELDPGAGFLYFQF